MIVSPYVLDGGLFDGFYIPLMSVLFKPLKHKRVAEIIHEAILHRREEVMIPSIMHLVVFILNVIPHRLLDYLTVLFRIYIYIYIHYTFS